MKTFSSYCLWKCYYFIKIQKKILRSHNSKDKVNYVQNLRNYSKRNKLPCAIESVDRQMDYKYLLVDTCTFFTFIWTMIMSHILLISSHKYQTCCGGIPMGPIIPDICGCDVTPIICGFIPICMSKTFTLKISKPSAVTSYFK